MQDYKKMNKKRKENGLAKIEKSFRVSSTLPWRPPKLWLLPPKHSRSTTGINRCLRRDDISCENSSPSPTLERIELVGGYCQKSSLKFCVSLAMNCVGD
ncbi:Phytanoyl-CoA dioxygenase [Trichinella spiralis]|uniref:Phytanoyl-CoA dioxygenase n=1 Tax=Trichinella spiralis TaxID=6334 RepID=A0ABR3KAW4_TRISP